MVRSPREAPGLDANSNFIQASAGEMFSMAAGVLAELFLGFRICEIEIRRLNESGLRVGASVVPTPTQVRVGVFLRLGRTGRRAISQGQGEASMRTFLRTGVLPTHWSILPQSRACLIVESSETPG